MADSQQPTLFVVTDDAENGPELNGAAPQGTPRGAKKPKEPPTSKQQLSSTIKSVRDLLRKDAGLSGDTDRLPQLTWLLFLKSLDDFDYAQEAMLGDIYLPVVEAPYRWRDWAAIADKAN